MTTKDTDRWERISQKILAALDIEAEYRKLGVEFTSSQPNSTGWLSCWALGRPHGNNPSAAVNVSDGPLRGRYVDRGRSGDSLSLWDFAAKYSPGISDWKAARREYAKIAGLAKQLPKTGEDEGPEESIGFMPMVPHFQLLVKPLCEKYPGVTPESLVLCGATLCTYPKKSQQPQHCIALPAYGPHLIDGGPTGYCLMTTSGMPIMVFQGEGKPPRPEKRIVRGRSGLVGRHALQNLEKAEVIYKVEGMTGLLALQALIPTDKRDTHLVVANLCGATETTVPKEMAHIFAGRDVVIIHDRDKPGQDGTELWITALNGIAASVRNLQLPYEMEEAHGKDLRDWINEGHAYDDLVQLAQDTEPVTEAQAAEVEITSKQAMLRQLGILVLGEIESTNTVMAFSAKLNKMVEIRQVEKYKMDTFVQNFGEEMEELVHVSREQIAGKFCFADVRRAIAAEGGKHRITDRNQLGIGVWALNNRLLLVGAGEVAILNGHLERSHVPTLEGRLLDFGGSDPWFDFEQLEKMYDLSADPLWCRAVMKEATDLFARWDNWKHRHNPELVAALVVATWIQTVWDWRPQVAVSAATNTGKTCLLQQAIAGLFGPMAAYMTKPTEAGLRQEIKNTSRVVILDEFEADAHRQKILELMRTSSRGGKITRGTANQKGTSFGLKHIVWVGAIESGLNRAADKNRFIMLELNKLNKKPGDARLVVPPPAQLADLGMRMLTVAMRHWKSATSLARDLAAKGLPGVDYRVVESFSVACGVLGACLGLNVEQSQELMAKILADRDLTGQEEQDEERLLRDIYESIILLPQGKRLSVGELLTGKNSDDTHIILNQHGIKKIDETFGRPEKVFFSKTMKRTLLKDSEWRDMQVEEILLRIPGAERSKQRMNGTNYPRGVSVPSRSIAELIGDTDGVGGDDIF